MDKYTHRETGTSILMNMYRERKSEREMDINLIKFFTGIDRQRDTNLMKIYRERGSDTVLMRREREKDRERASEGYQF